jgi:hypothetical protein
MSLKRYFITYKKLLVRLMHKRYSNKQMRKQTEIKVKKKDLKSYNRGNNRDEIIEEHGMKQDIHRKRNTNEQ